MTLRTIWRGALGGLAAAVAAGCGPDSRAIAAPALATPLTLGDGPHVKRVGTPPNLPGPSSVELVTGQIIGGECKLREFAKKVPGQYTIFIEYDKVACRGVAGHFDWNRQLDAQLVIPVRHERGRAPTRSPARP